MPAHLPSGALLTLVALVPLMYAEYRESTALRLLAKPLASAGFLWLAVERGALESSAGIALFVGLCLSLVGDVALIFKQRPLFLGGLVAFLLAHVGFVAAAFIHGIDGLWCAGAAALILPFGALIFLDLHPKLPADMRGPVIAYVVVICLMVISTAGAAGATPALSGFALAAFLFFLSDISVALDRFAGGGFGNRALGLPLYYTAQLCMAGVAAVFAGGAGA